MVTDFLTPSTSVLWTHPPELTAKFGEYLFDVPNFRADDKKDRETLQSCSAQELPVENF